MYQRNTGILGQQFFIFRFTNFRIMKSRGGGGNKKKIDTSSTLLTYVLLVPYINFCWFFLCFLKGFLPQATQEIQIEDS